MSQETYTVTLTPEERRTLIQQGRELTNAAGGKTWFYPASYAIGIVRRIRGSGTVVLKKDVRLRQWVATASQGGKTESRLERLKKELQGFKKNDIVFS